MDSSPPSGEGQSPPSRWRSTRGPPVATRDSPSPSRESQSPPSRWRSTRGPPVATRGGCRGRRNPLRGGPAGRVVSPVDDVPHRRRSARRPTGIQFHPTEDYSSPIPPRSPSGIRFPISPGRYGALRSPNSIGLRVQRPRHGTPPLSPPIDDEWQHHRRGSPHATLPCAMGSPARPRRLLSGPIDAPLPRVESPPPPIAIAKEEEGCEGSDSWCCKRLDQKFIARDNLEMTLSIAKRESSDDGSGRYNHVYSVVRSGSSLKRIRGFYIFPLDANEHLLFQEPGFFKLSFSLKEFKDIQLNHKVQVRASAGVGRWKVLNYDKNELYRVRVGSSFRPFSIVCNDRNKKRLRFETTPKLVIKLIASGQILAEVRNKKVEISSDKFMMKIKELVIETSKLDDIRPNYEATLHISTPDEALYVALQCQVIPQTPNKITVHPTNLRKVLLPGQIIEELALEVFDEYGNHVKEDENVVLRLDGFSLQDGSGIIRAAGIDCKEKVDANGRIDLSNSLKVSRGYGKRVLLSVISKNEVIFELRFQTEVRELRPVQKAFMNCEAGSVLEHVAFEIVDSEGMVDESIHHEDKHGQSHTLAIKCESFRVDDSEQYKFHYGRCTIPSIQLPDTEGVMYFQAVHSRFPDLNSAIKVHIEKSQQENRERLASHEDVGDPMVPDRKFTENELIPQNTSSHKPESRLAAQVSRKVSNSALISHKVHLENPQQEMLVTETNQEDVWSPLPARRSHMVPDRNLSENELISQNISSHIPQSRMAAQVSRKVSNSALISHKVHLENPQQEKLVTETNQEDVWSPLPAQRSQEHERISAVSPTLRVSPVVNEAFASPYSKGVLPISNSPALTPKSEHIGAQAGTLDILCSKKKLSMDELEDEVANSRMQMSKHEKNLNCLNLNQLHIQQEILQLQAVIGRDPVMASSFCDQQSTLEQINSRSNSAAAVICKMLDDKPRRLDVVGLVALLGTFKSIELSRVLAQYLGEDQMLAIVCRSFAGLHSLETSTLHKMAADLGLSISGGYNVFCLEDIRPKFGEPSKDPQGLLPLQPPTMPNGNVPRGFVGYAVNLINIEPNPLQCRTRSGHSLRETLFHRLFGMLQVYKDRDCMMAARSCIEAGAVSLDGGVIRGNGLISLGHWEPKILFPVMNKAVCPEKLRILEAKEMELAKINRRIDLENDALKRTTEKFDTCVKEYRRFLSQTGAE